MESTDTTLKYSSSISTGQELVNRNKFSASRSSKWMIFYVASEESREVYNLTMELAEPSRKPSNQIILPTIENRELIDPPEGLSSDLEAQGWLNSSKSILDFWNSDEDSIYDNL